MRAGIVVAIAIAFSATAHAAPVPASHACMGPWIGEGYTPGFTTPWGITLTLTASPAGGRCGTIEYTNPLCGGTLEECNLVGADIHTREIYTHNEGGCSPPGRVIIRCEGEQMRYRWVGQYQADSTLRRPAGYVPPAPPTKMVDVAPAPIAQPVNAQSAIGSDDDGGFCAASPRRSSPIALIAILSSALALRARRGRDRARPGRAPSAS